MRVRMIASKRVSSAGKIPPIIMSQISVVVASIAPAIRPESMSRSIARPPRADSVEHDRIGRLRKHRGDTLNALRRHAEHGEADRGPADGDGDRVARADHAGERVRRIAEHAAGDRVQALHVGDGGEHRDVGFADIGRDVAGRDGRDDDLRHTNRQRTEGRRDKRGVAAPAGPDDAGDIRAAWRGTRAKAWLIAVTARPRSAWPRTEAVPSGCHAATSPAAKSVVTWWGRVERSTVRVRMPVARSAAAMKWSSSPLVSKVPQT